MVDKVKIVQRIVGEKYFTDDISLERRNCNGIRHRNARCRRCVEICPTSAITIDKRTLEIDNEKCNHCGACVTVCPSQALLSNWLPWKDLLAAGINSVEAAEGHPVIACAKALSGLDDEHDYDREKVVELQCLERIDEGLVLALAASGAKDIRILCDDCIECEDGCMGAVWTIVVDDAVRMMRAVGCDVQVNVVDGIPEDIAKIDHAKLTNKSLSRRDLFSGFRDEAKDASMVVFEEALKDTKYGLAAAVLGIQLPGGGTAMDNAKRGKVCEWALGSLALECASDDGSAESAIENLEGVSIESRIFSNIYIDGEKCRNCYLCVAYCRPFALQKYMDFHKVIGFLTTPGLCTQCELCLDLCKHDAILLDGRVSISDLLMETTRSITYARWDEEKAARKAAEEAAAAEAEAAAAGEATEAEAAPTESTGETAVESAAEEAAAAEAEAAGESAAEEAAEDSPVSTADGSATEAAVVDAVGEVAVDEAADETEAVASIGAATEEEPAEA